MAGKGPQFITYMKPIINVLRDMGGAGKSSEVIDEVIQLLKIPDEKIQITNKNGGSKVKNRINWARFYLVKAGMIDSSKYGFWALTDEGWNKEFDTYKLWKQVHQVFLDEKKEKKPEVDEDGDESLEEEDHAQTLLQILRNLSPEGFEKICKRLLRESGFQNVEVTGRKGDQGIDGIGILQVNPLVSFKVIFQCKKYAFTTPVTPSHVRDFRGAMTGRADKGIILTTGRFTNDAKSEAIREGAPPIELVDGEKLVEMFESLELGLKPKMTYEVNKEFFKDYQ